LGSDIDKDSLKSQTRTNHPIESHPVLCLFHIYRSVQVTITSRTISKEESNLQMGNQPKDYGCKGVLRTTL
jgi:hypothetical protein